MKSIPLPHEIKNLKSPEQLVEFLRGIPDRPFDILQFDTTEAWLAERKHHIGASEAAIILGLSTFKTRDELFAEKSGAQKDIFHGNDRTIRGQMEEPLIRALWAIEHPDYDVYDGTNIIMVSKSRPWQSCSLDMVIVHRDTGLMTVGEIKTGEPGKQWEGGYCPNAYFAQLCHQLEVTNFHSALLIARIIYNSELHNSTREKVYTFLAEDEEMLAERRNITKYESQFVDDLKAGRLRPMLNLSVF